jgi:hypothetical protein
MTVSCHVCRYSKTLAGNSRPQNQKKCYVAAVTLLTADWLVILSRKRRRGNEQRAPVPPWRAIVLNY